MHGFMSSALLSSLKLPLVWLYGSMGLVSILTHLYVFNISYDHYFQFDRSMITTGEYWRLFTCHFLHLSSYHLIMNLLGLGMVIYILNLHESWLVHFIFILFNTLFVSFFLLFFAPDLQWYVGLSGILHGLFIFALYSSPHYSYWIKAVIYTSIVAKILWEYSPYYDDMSSFDNIGGRVEYRAHFYGVLAGVTFIILCQIKKRFLKRE